MEISQNVILYVVFCLRLVHRRIKSVCNACSSIYIVVISEITYSNIKPCFLRSETNKAMLSTQTAMNLLPLCTEDVSNKFLWFSTQREFAIVNTICQFDHCIFQSK